MSTGEALWGVIAFGFAIMLIVMFINAFGDLFGRGDLSGWAKAVWVVFLVALPLIGVLAYFITRPKSLPTAARPYEFPSEQTRRLGV